MLLDGQVAQRTTLSSGSVPPPPPPRLTPGPVGLVPPPPPPLVQPTGDRSDDAVDDAAPVASDSSRTRSLLRWTRLGVVLAIVGPSIGFVTHEMLHAQDPSPVSMAQPMSGTDTAETTGTTANAPDVDAVAPTAMRTVERDGLRFTVPADATRTTQDAGRFGTATTWAFTADGTTMRVEIARLDDSFSPADARPYFDTITEISVSSTNGTLVSAKKIDGPAQHSFRNVIDVGGLNVTTTFMVDRSWMVSVVGSDGTTTRPALFDEIVGSFDFS